MQNYLGVACRVAVALSAVLPHFAAAGSEHLRVAEVATLQWKPLAGPSGGRVASLIYGIQQLQEWPASSSAGLGRRRVHMDAIVIRGSLTLNSGERQARIGPLGYFTIKPEERMLATCTSLEPCALLGVFSDPSYISPGTVSSPAVSAGWEGAAIPTLDLAQIEWETVVEWKGISRATRQHAALRLALNVFFPYRLTEHAPLKTRDDIDEPGVMLLSGQLVWRTEGKGRLIGPGSFVQGRPSDIARLSCASEHCVVLSSSPWPTYAGPIRPLRYPRGAPEIGH
jgi:hypothetical protein